MTQAEYARHRNKSPQYIGKLYKAGMGRPGKLRPSYAYASERWGLTRAEFDVELAEAYGSIRRYLRQKGLGGRGDLEF